MALLMCKINCFELKLKITYNFTVQIDGCDSVTKLEHSDVHCNIWDQPDQA